MQAPHSFQGAPALPPGCLPPHVVGAVRELARNAEPVCAYLYDLDAAERRARALRDALPPWALLYFAVKANSFPPLLRRLAGVVDGFEVASASEVELALAAAAGGTGGPVRLAASGPGKTEPLLDRLVRAGNADAAPPAAPPSQAAVPVARDVIVNVESELELHRLSAAATAHGRTARVALRVNPRRVPMTGGRTLDGELAGVGALAMGGVPGPFGIPEPEVDAAVRTARRLPGLDLVGFHVHAASGNLDAAVHLAYVRWCLEWAVETAARHAFPLSHVDVGGGLGFPFEGERPFDLARFSDGLRELRPPEGVRVVLEPGRWLAAPIGWYAAEVTDIKCAYDTHFAVVRGGINHFQLPTSWEIRHNFGVVAVDDWPPARPRPRARGVPLTVSGELCTPEDVLARDVTVSLLRAGDVVVFPNAGAYGFEFAMPGFLGHPPARRLVVSEGLTKPY